MLDMRRLQKSQEKVHRGAPNLRTMSQAWSRLLLAGIVEYTTTRCQS
jgi:hypothetical protein